MRSKIDSSENLPKGNFKQEASNNPCRDFCTRNECSSSEKLVQSDCVQDVFLSHSGAQKNFVRQLHRDLTREGVSCFFDEDPQSLPFAENFPARIFEAAEKCKVAVLVLSVEFIRSKWPMLELSAFVNAKNTGKNPNLKLLPLFFKIDTKTLSQITLDNEAWRKLEKVTEKQRIEWHEALKEVRSINGLTFKEGEDEVRFRDKIVKEIRSKLPESPRYDVSFMRGQTRMCEELEALFKRVSPSAEKGIHIAGLYGLAGSGKTTLTMAFCNFNFKGFEGKVCHVEFQYGKSVERVKRVLQHLTNSTETLLNSLTTEEVAWEMLTKKVSGQLALLVLDNITEDPEIINEVRVYLGAEFGRGSRILLGARSLQILNNFIPAKSCMHVPSLTEEEALSILLDSTSLRESNLKADDRCKALKYAKRCWFRERSDDMVGVGRFHPLGLKAFGRYLFNKFGSTSDLSNWVGEMWVGEMSDFPRVGSADLQDVFGLLDKAYHGFDHKHRTIFMILSLYLPPKMSSDHLYELLAVACNEEIPFIEDAVRKLCREAFIERIDPEIRVHDLLIEFARYKADKMEKWLWVKADNPRRQLISEDKRGFELARFENCRYSTPSRVREKFFEKLLAFQLIHMQNFKKLDLRSMENARSITIHNCPDLEEIKGMDNLTNLAWLQIIQVNPRLKFPMLSGLKELRYLEMDIPNYNEVDKDGKPASFQSNHSAMQLGDLTGCYFLKEIYVRCPFLTEFPQVRSLPYLEKVEFVDCFNVRGALDCTGCSELHTLVFNFCTEMAHLPLMTGCSKLSKLVVWQCNALTACPEIKGQTALETLELCISSEAGQSPIHFDSCLGLKNLQLWKLGRLKMLPDLSRLSKLIILKLHECGLTQPPDLTSCPLLQDISFFTLKKLERFPNFSQLRALKKLSLCNCKSVTAPPDIGGCSQLQVFYLLYNDNMKGLPGMPPFSRLEEIKLSWYVPDQVLYEGSNVQYGYHDEEDEGDELEFCLDYWKDDILDVNLSDVNVPEAMTEWWTWLESKTMLVKRYFRGVKLCYSIVSPSPYETYTRRSTPFHKHHKGICCIPVTPKHRNNRMIIRPPNSLASLTIQSIMKERSEARKREEILNDEQCNGEGARNIYHALERLPVSFEQPAYLDLGPWEALERLDLKLKALERLDLSGSYFLVRLPSSFGELKAVENLDLSGCKVLERLPESFGELKALENLDLSGCKALDCLPESFGELKALKRLYLCKCKALERLPESFGELKALKLLYLYCCDALEGLPQSFGELKALERLHLCHCKALKGLSESFGKLKALENLDLSSCTALEHLPESFGELNAVENLDLLNCKALKLLPESFGELKALERLHLCHCKALKRLPESFGKLKALENLDLSRCKALERLPESFGELKALKRLYLSGCYALQRLPLSFGELKALGNLDLPLCKALKCLPQSFGELKALENLDLSGCKALERLPESFGELKALKRLYLSGCYALECLPLSFEELKSLERLHLCHCKALKGLSESFGKLKALENLDLSSCTALKHLPESFGELRAVKNLDLLNCKALKRLPESFGELKALERLHLCQCKTLKRLPESFGELKALENLDLSGCKALERLPESFGELKALKRLYLSGCYALERLPLSFGELKAMEHLDLPLCKALKCLPESFGELKALENLDLSGCKALERLPESFGELKVLKLLYLSCCEALEHLPESFGKLKALENLDLSGCKVHLPGSFLPDILRCCCQWGPYWQKRVEEYFRLLSYRSELYEGG